MLKTASLLTVTGCGPPTQTLLRQMVRAICVISVSHPRITQNLIQDEALALRLAKRGCVVHSCCIGFHPASKIISMLLHRLGSHAHVLGAIKPKGLFLFF